MNCATNVPYSECPDDPKIKFGRFQCNIKNLKKMKGAWAFESPTNIIIITGECPSFIKEGVRVEVDLDEKKIRLEEES